MAEAHPVTSGLFVEDAAGPRLIAAQCNACGKAHFPADPVCPYCAADGCRELRVGPAARLRLYTAVRTAPPGYQGPVPYGFGVVELPGGLCVIARLTEARLERLHVGQPMELVIEPLHTDAEGHQVLSYAFRPQAS